MDISQSWIGINGKLSNGFGYTKNRSIYIHICIYIYIYMVVWFFQVATWGCPTVSETCKWLWGKDPQSMLRDWIDSSGDLSICIYDNHICT